MAILSPYIQFPFAPAGQPGSTIMPSPPGSPSGHTDASTSSETAATSDSTSFSDESTGKGKLVPDLIMKIFTSFTLSPSLAFTLVSKAVSSSSFHVSLCCMESVVKRECRLNLCELFPDVPGPCTPNTSSRKRAHSPRAQRYIDRLRNQVNRYRKALYRLKAKLNTKGKEATKHDALRVLRKFIPKDLYLLLSSNVHLLSVKKNGRRWSPEMQKFALCLYFHGPAAYRFIASTMALPSPRSIRRWLSRIEMRPGIIPGVMETIEKATENWSREDRVCCLMFDEMSINQHLQYDVARDIVTGFADDGQERTAHIANSALVMMVSGISKSWIQPVAYLFARNGASPSTIKDLIVAIITRLQEINVWVKVVVCDQGSNNVSASMRLNVSPDEPYFVVNSEKVYFLFDTPHLIKCTRNNLRAHKLQIGSETVDWCHIVALHESTHPLRTKLAPNLTDKHVYKFPFADMNVKRATQVLSATVSLALLVLISLNVLPASAKPTADFLEQMDNLFDVLNSMHVEKKGKKLRYAICEGSEHHNFLNDCLSWLDKWKFDTNRPPHTVRGWKITIKGTLLLWEELHSDFGFSRLLTRRLQQDPLENLFGTIRKQHGCNEHPNAFQFTAGLKHVSISKMMKLSRKGNCEEDSAVMLSEMATRNSNAATSTQTPHAAMEGTQEPTPSPHTREKGIVDENVSYYMTGCLVREFLKRRPQECVCERFLKPEDAESLHSSHQFLALLRAHDVPGELFANVTVPSEELFHHVQEMETIFLDTVGSVAQCDNVKTVLYNALERHTTVFCSPNCQDHFRKMYVAKRFKWHLRFINRTLKLQRSRHSAAARKMRKLATVRKPPAANVPHSDNTDTV